MASVQEKRAWRTALLHALYDTVDGAPKSKHVDYRILGPRVGVSEPELANAVEWLIDRGLAEWTAMGGLVGITPRGVDAVEEEIADARPSSFDVEVATVTDQKVVERFLSELGRLEETLTLARDELATLEAEKASLEAQLRSPRPNKGVVRAALRGIAWLSQQAGGGVVGNAAYEALRQLA